MWIIVAVEMEFLNPLNIFLCIVHTLEIFLEIFIVGTGTAGPFVQVK